MYDCDRMEPVSKFGFEVVRLGSHWVVISGLCWGYIRVMLGLGGGIIEKSVEVLCLGVVGG